MPFSPKNLQIQLRLWITPFGFNLLRFCERSLPQSVLSFLLWPPAAVWSVFDLSKRVQALSVRRNCPPSWKVARGKFLRHQIAGWTHTRFIYVWGDRLRHPHWQRRYRVESNPEADALIASDRPIIFTSLHYGPFETLPLWLRSRGIPATAVVGRQVHPRRQRFHRRVAPGNTPLTVSVKSLRQIRKCLGPGGRVIIWMDVDRGEQIDLPAGDLCYRLSVGAIRLAAITGAEIIPCLISEEGTWNFVVSLGAPVPQSYLGRSPNTRLAANHLLRESLRIVARDPSQCGHRFLSRISFPIRDSTVDVPLTSPLSPPA